MEALFPSEHPRQKGNLLRELLQLRIYDSVEDKTHLLNENNYRERIQSCACNDFGKSPVEDYVEIRVDY